MKNLTPAHLKAVDRVLSVISDQKGIDRNLLSSFYQYFLNRKRQGDVLLPLDGVVELCNEISRQRQGQGQ